MKKLEKIFSTFSLREKPPQPFKYALPTTFRNRILLFCEDTFSNKDNPYSPGNYLGKFWNEIHNMLQYRVGRPQLSISTPFINVQFDASAFLLSCKEEEFLDFVEYIFKVDCFSYFAQNEKELVGKANQLFAADGLGYELTDFIREEREGSFFGKKVKTSVIIHWPQVIRKDSQTIHETALRPALLFLSDPAYKSADSEYLEALDDYRKGDYGDSLTKSCSAFESVMKIMCERHKWQYSQDDTAGPLIRAIGQNGKLESHFEQNLLMIATLRNRYSKSHGAGVKPKKATQEIALFGLNLTASAILFLSQSIK